MDITVRIVDNGLGASHTRWVRGDWVVIHDPEGDAFLCCTSTGEFVLSTRRLGAALNWLAGK